MRPRSDTSRLNNNDLRFHRGWRSALHAAGPGFARVVVRVDPHVAVHGRLRPARRDGFTRILCSHHGIVGHPGLREPPDNQRDQDPGVGDLFADFSLTFGEDGETEDAFCMRRCPVELRGLEPLTPSMPWRCATSCATAPVPFRARLLYPSPRDRTKSPWPAAHHKDSPRTARQAALAVRGKSC